MAMFLNTNALNGGRTEESPLKAGQFPATMWSMISGARQENEAALVALERLARAYWQPLYGFVRQRGNSHEDAADAVQGFFEYLLQKDILNGVERRETRFRTFLLHCLSNWLVSNHRRITAVKRGGEEEVISLAEAEQRKSWKAEHQEASAEVAYDRHWAQTIFERAQDRLSEENAAQTRAAYLQEIQQRVFHPGLSGPSWVEVAEKFEVSEGAVRKAAADLRARFAVLLRQEVSALVSADEEVDDELRYLFRVLSGAS